MKAPDDDHFILSVFDRERWCPVLQALLGVRDLEALREILGEVTADDPQLESEYVLNEEDLATVRTVYGVALDLVSLELADIDVSVFRKPVVRSVVPYLIHTGYELPLLLEGRKKLARITWEYPPAGFPGEDRFDVWVDKGKLGKVVTVEPFDHPIREVQGLRTVYYTPVGEEWRVQAMRLVWAALRQGDAWNETFERLEGMLFGYEDWQNDWWIANCRFAGMAFCCGVTALGLAWIEASGFRALPPVTGSHLSIISLDQFENPDAKEVVQRNLDDVALVRFDIAGRHLMNLVDLRQSGPWAIPADAIPSLNRYLSRPITVLLETIRR